LHIVEKGGPENVVKMGPASDCRHFLMSFEVIINYSYPTRRQTGIRVNPGYDLAASGVKTPIAGIDHTLSCFPQQLYKRVLLGNISRIVG